VTFQAFCMLIAECGWCGTVRDAPWWLIFGRITGEMADEQEREQHDWVIKQGHYAGSREEWEALEEGYKEKETWVKQRHKERYSDVL